MFQCYVCHLLNGSGPACLSELLHVYTPSCTLRSSDTHMLKIQQYKRKSHGFCAFSCFGLHVWNSLPQDLNPILNWANGCSPNILRTVRRTMIHFLTELLVCRTWFGQFAKLYLVLNWLMMECTLWPELAAEAQLTA